MKKIFISLILCFVMVISALSLVACGDEKWENASSMTDYGNVISNGGFIAETDKYLYYINGFASYGEDNTFGNPIKGSLMAVEKSTLGSNNVKTEIVVPKLFVAEDYNAGVYIYGDYVYYGTPSTDLNNHGEVARGEMTFTRSKLDGSSTETFFTVNFLNYTYRFVEKGGVVYLIYYNAGTSSLICYNTSNKTEVTIAKEDDKTKDVWESLSGYTFLPGEGVDDLVLVYTVKCFAENYYEEKDDGSNYARAEEEYNKIYTYVPGDGVASGSTFRGKCILNGSSDDVTFSTGTFTEEFFFFTAKDSKKEVSYGVKTRDILLHRNDFQSFAVQDSNKIENPEYIGGFVYDEDGDGKDINDPIYTMSYGEDTTNENGETVASSEVYVVKTTLTGNAKTEYVRLAKVGTASELINVKKHGNDLYAYYYNSMNCISRIKLVDITDGGEFALEEKLSEDTVGSSWYSPEFITISGNDYVFYLDNTTAGASYVKYLKITDVELLPEYEDEDEEEIKRYYATGHQFLGQITTSDEGGIAAAYLNKIGETLEYTIEDGVVKVDKDDVVKARQAYDNLSAMGKLSYGNANLAKLIAAEKAVALLEKGLAKLEGIENYYFYNEITRQAYKDVYNAIKEDMESVKNTSAVLDFIDNNLKWAFYEKATDLFA